MSEMEYLKCDVCPFWNIVDFNSETKEDIWDCTVSTPEEADLIGDEMWCMHKYDDKEKLED